MAQEKSINIPRLIFGLKVRQLRQEKGLSFASLSELTGLSISYLNEIEKGKKFPKEDKLNKLAQELNTTPNQLISSELEGSLEPVGDLLRSNFLDEFPLDLLGIGFNKLIELIANSPLRFKAFISTLIDLSRSYPFFKQENFYHAALRSYQELHFNYFEDIEQSVDDFVAWQCLNSDITPSVDVLREKLIQLYDVKVLENGLENYPELQYFRCIFIAKERLLLFNKHLSIRQRTYHLAKEIGFQVLKIKERPYISSSFEVNNFEQVLNNYKAGYFAVALLINRHRFINDLNQFFNQGSWNPNFLFELMSKYQASPEVLFQRFNLLPHFFQMKKIFFMRVIHNTTLDKFEIDKEIHFHRKHRPYVSNRQEHYCRRWLALAVLSELKDCGSKDDLIGIQKSKYIDINDEYLCMTIGRVGHPFPDRNVSVTVGILLDDHVKSIIKFHDDASIKVRNVNVTCERCSLSDCKERAAPPLRIEMKKEIVEVKNALERLVKDYSR